MNQNLSKQAKLSPDIRHSPRNQRLPLHQINRTSPNRYPSPNQFQQNMNQFYHPNFVNQRPVPNYPYHQSYQHNLTQQKISARNSAERFFSPQRVLEGRKSSPRRISPTRVSPLQFGRYPSPYQNHGYQNRYSPLRYCSSQQNLQHLNMISHKNQIYNSELPNARLNSPRNQTFQADESKIIERNQILEKENIHLKDQLLKLSNQFSEQAKIQQNLMKEFEKFQQAQIEVTEKENQIQALKNELDQVSTSIESISSELMEISYILKRKENEIIEKNQQLAELTLQNQDLFRRLNTTNNLHDQSKINSLLQELQKKENEIFSLKSMQGDNNIKTIIKQQYEEKITSLQTDNLNLQIKIAALEQNQDNSQEANLWKEKFRQLNSEFYQNEAKLILALQDLENYKILLSEEKKKNSIQSTKFGLPMY